MLENPIKISDREVTCLGMGLELWDRLAEEHRRQHHTVYWATSNEEKKLAKKELGGDCIYYLHHQD